VMQSLRQLPSLEMNFMVNGITGLIPILPDIVLFVF
jgi:hypothetical protein